MGWPAKATSIGQAPFIGALFGLAIQPGFTATPLSLVLARRNGLVSS
jgi:hypothetical protein